ncbi:armadillo-type protein [Powellomyces hirtus]|nr:armadillo-type protein [Powellomyces hirtus]
MLLPHSLLTLLEHHLVKGLHDEQSPVSSEKLSAKILRSDSRTRCASAALATAESMQSLVHPGKPPPAAASGKQPNTWPSSSMFSTLRWLAKNGTPAARMMALHHFQAHITTLAPHQQFQELLLDLMKDDSEGVRMLAMHSFWQLYMLLNKTMDMTIRSHTQKIDSMFIAICGMLGDPAYAIRAKACVYLGTFDRVTSRPLAQSLQKNAISSSQKQKSKQNTQQSSTVDPQVFGAFVHGVEDEFEIVRNAAVDSLTSLSMNSSSFTTAALSFFVDMFNDEAESVRLNSIVSFHQLAHVQVVTLNEEQIKMMSMVLQDSSQEVRLAAHRFLGVVRALNAAGLMQMLDILLQGIRRFPTDNASAYECLRNIGKTNADIIDPLLPKVFHLDKRYLPREQDLGDLDYIHRLVCLLSASTKRKLTFPRFVEQHALYVQAKFPSLIREESNLDSDIPDCRSEAASQWTTTANDLSTSFSSNRSLKDLSTAPNVRRDLRRMEYLKSDHNARPQFLSDYLQCSELFHNIEHHIRYPHHRVKTRLNAAMLARTAYRMASLYVGLTKGMRYRLALVRFFANLVWVITQDTINDGMIRNLISRIEVLGRLKVREPADGIDLTDIAQSLASTVSSTSSVSAVGYLMMLIQSFTFPTLSAPPILLSTTAVLHYTTPDGTPLPPNKASPLFVAGRICNPLVLSNVAIQLTSNVYPPRLFWPAPANLMPKSGAPSSYDLLPIRTEQGLPRARATTANLVYVIRPEAPEDVAMFAAAASGRATTEDTVLVDDQGQSVLVFHMHV